MNKTVFVLLSDLVYYERALITINDLRTIGKWNGDIVLITIDFNHDNKYDVINVRFPIIDKSYLLNKIGPNGFSNSDKREINKLKQWEKLHVFDEYFIKWDRVVYLDAGLRVCDDVKFLLDLDYKNKLLAQNDASPNYNADKIFKSQLSFDNSPVLNKLLLDFGGDSIFNSHYMLNCMWVYDTNILNIFSKSELISAMNSYPICKTNEMTVMNLIIHFKHKLWHPFPLKASNGKYLFEWCELNHSFPTTWRDYCFIKYPITLALSQSPYN